MQSSEWLDIEWYVSTSSGPRGRLLRHFSLPPRQIIVRDPLKSSRNERGKAKIGNGKDAQTQEGQTKGRSHSQKSGRIVNHARAHAHASSVIVQ